MHYIHIHIYIYIERERDRYVYPVYTYIYIYIWNWSTINSFATCLLFEIPLRGLAFQIKLYDKYKIHPQQHKYYLLKRPLLLKRELEYRIPRLPSPANLAAFEKRKSLAQVSKRIVSIHSHILYVHNICLL